MPHYRPTYPPTAPSWSPPYQPPRENGWGVAGFIVSLLALVLTCGLLSPVGLLISLVGLLRRPRGLATAGTILGLLGTAGVAAVVGFFVFVGYGVSESIEVNRNTAVTRQAIEQANLQIRQHQAEQGRLPDGIEGNKLVIPHRDAWDQPLRFDREVDSYVIRSAGPDGEFETADDLESSRTFQSAPPTFPTAPPIEAPRESPAAQPEIQPEPEGINLDLEG